MSSVANPWVSFSNRFADKDLAGKNVSYDKQKVTNIKEQFKSIKTAWEKCEVYSFYFLSAANICPVECFVTLQPPHSWTGLTINCGELKGELANAVWSTWQTTGACNADDAGRKIWIWLTGTSSPYLNPLSTPAKKQGTLISSNYSSPLSTKHQNSVI